MKLCRFLTTAGDPSFGLIHDDSVVELSDRFARLSELFEVDDLKALIAGLNLKGQRHFHVRDVKLLAPIDRQEVWAAGVTYLRSKTARMDESQFGAVAYDRVYDAPRPELFFKSLPDKVVGPHDAIGIRADAQWSVPEPELALVLNSRGDVVGYTIGNDMSSRDIEGENLLYLPQAKVYRRSCALGPCVVVGASEADARVWEIHMTIERKGAVVFKGKTTPGQIKRSFTELAQYLFRSQEFQRGAVLLTGAGIVPPDDFTLRADDCVHIEISGIGRLDNPVTVV